MLIESCKSESIRQQPQEQINYEYQPDQEHGLSIFGGILSIISSIMGGGIVGIPYVIYMLGLIPSLTMMIIMGIMVVNSGWLLLKTKDLCPGKPESLYELGYIVFKRPSIFILSALIAILGLGMCIIYFILFGDTCGSVLGALFGFNNVSTFYNGANLEFTRTVYIIVLSILLSPIMLKKQL
jgi:amino acid permease